MQRKLPLSVFVGLVTLLITPFVAISQTNNPNISPTPFPTPTSTRPDNWQKLLEDALKKNLAAQEDITITNPPVVRGIAGDHWADIIIGQPNFSQITPNEVVGNKLFNPSGVYVDRSMQPNRVYVYDGGNNRILGLSSLGKCLAGASIGQACTTDSDCPGSICQIDPDRSADIILGQPNSNTSACNGDSGFQNYPTLSRPSADTLCGMRWNQISITEGGSAVTMVVDARGNLYVPDVFNNRILRYNDPFNTDTIADYVWGQADFNGLECNQGGIPDATRICLTPTAPYLGAFMTGVALSKNGDLWFTDTKNNRVLRFPFNPNLGIPSKTADLVLGQPDFSSNNSGNDLNQMDKPASVRVHDNGTLYVTDGVKGIPAEGRVLVFSPPFTNGMYATGTLGDDLGEPTGLELAPDGSLWVNDCNNQRLLNFLNGQLQVEIANVPKRVWGGLGVDSDGNVMTTGWDPQQVLRYSHPTYQQDVVALQADEFGSFNKRGPRGFNGLALGLEVTENQLIVGDMGRLLFWNTLNLSNHQAADGVIGQPDLNTNPRWDPVFGRMRTDQQGNLWVVHGSLAFGFGMFPVIQAYHLPLTTGQTPHLVITSPITLQGGGSFAWGSSLILAGIDIQPNCDCLWLSDELNHRVFRIKNATTAPVVDIILGQLNASGNECNQGRGYSSPSADSLCHPGGLSFDNEGNLFIADHNLECDGNLRLLKWNTELLPVNPPSVLYGIPASQIFDRDNNFAEPDCLNSRCAPWEPAFNSQGYMVVGFNGYLGSRFPYGYKNIFSGANLFDFYSMPFSTRFDQSDNLYVLDHNRNRVLIYLQPGFEQVWLPLIFKK